MISVLRKLPNSSGSKRLVLFHHAGGNGAQYFPSLKAHAQHCEIYCLDLPGRFFRFDEPAFTQMTDLIAVIKQQLEALPPLPTYFFGHSFGSLVTYALAWELYGNYPLCGLGISALRAPSPENLQRYAKFKTLTDPELLVEIEKYSELPELVKSQPALLGLTLTALRSDFEIMASFKNPHSQQKLELPSVVFGGTKDPQVSLQDLSAWQEYVTISHSPYLFEGDHFYIFQNMPSVLDKLLRL